MKCVENGDENALKKIAVKKIRHRLLVQLYLIHEVSLHGYEQSLKYKTLSEQIFIRKLKATGINLTLQLIEKRLENL